MNRFNRRKVRLYNQGKCIYCGQSRDKKLPDGRVVPSPYKRQCVECAVKDRMRKQKTQKSDPWVKGKRGRPPKVNVRYRERSKK